MPTFCPIDDQVLVRIEPPEETRGGLVVPDRAQERSLVGEVLAVGPGRARRDGTRQPLSVAVRDQVLVAKYAGDEVTLDGVPCLVVRADDLLGVLVPEPVQRYRLSDDTEGEWPIEPDTAPCGHPADRLLVARDGSTSCPACGVALEIRPIPDPRTCSFAAWAGAIGDNMRIILGRGAEGRSWVTRAELAAIARGTPHPWWKEADLVEGYPLGSWFGLEVYLHDPEVTS